MNLNLDLPWLEPIRQRLESYLTLGRRPHALLLSGPRGIGKSRLAAAFAARLLCRSGAERACGVCQSCDLLVAGTHPDLITLEPAEAGKPIPVDAIRDLIETLALKPQYGDRRVVILNPAHVLNAAAANSLLKTLEEPDAATLFLLVSDQPGALPATILSRCQHIDIPCPDHDVALRWLIEQGLSEQAENLLTIAHGAPLRAQVLAEASSTEARLGFFKCWQAVATGREAPIPAAEPWQKTAAEDLTDWMIGWTIDLIRLNAAVEPPALTNPDLQTALRGMHGLTDLPGLYRFLDRLYVARRQLAGNLNRQLLLEELLIHWSRTAVAKA